MTPDEFANLKPGDVIKCSPPFGSWATVNFISNGRVSIDVTTIITESDRNHWMLMTPTKTSSDQ